jgi:predicted nucleic acid-binding protein
VGLLIDTSTLIAWERALDTAPQQVAPLRSQDSFVSVVTASELLHGVHRARDAALRARRSASVELLLSRMPLLPIDVMVARAHARVWAELAAAGTVIGMNDMWLAATCLVHGLTMVTANIKDFKRVPGLTVRTAIDD